MYVCTHVLSKQYILVTSALIIDKVYIDGSFDLINDIILLDKTFGVYNNPTPFHCLGCPTSFQFVYTAVSAIVERKLYCELCTHIMVNVS